MRTIGLNEFIPPIFTRAAKFVSKKFSSLEEGKVKIHPFDSVPNDLNVKWIMDVGANVGDVAEAALKSYPNSKILCFEPVGQTHDQLTKRMSQFGERSTIYKVALSDNEATADINITTQHGANSLSPQAKFHQDFNPHVREVSKEKINLVRLDDFAVQFPTQKIDIMKIDVEGHELNVLKGGTHFIANNVDVIIIEISLMRDESLQNQAVFEIFSFLHNLGFCLLNVMDLHHVEGKAMQLVQMDCVFRNTRKMGLN